MYKKFIPILLLILILLFSFSCQKVEAALIELGARILHSGEEGSDVAVLQGKLKQLSLYGDDIDGIFGPATRKAVRDFQLSFGLTVDGIVGPETFGKLPPDTLNSRMAVSREDIILMARIIHGEARGEGFKGMVAVGAVILNRVASNKFPNTIREVIMQKGQFCSRVDGQAMYYPSQKSVEAAKAALLGYDPSHGSLFFYNPRTATNLTWISTRPVVTSIGEHLFAK